MNQTLGYEQNILSPEPHLKSKYSNSTKYVKSYSHYKPVETENSSMEYTNYHTSNFNPLRQ